MRIVAARVQVTRKTRRHDPARIAGLRLPGDVLLSRLPAVFPERIIDDLTQRYFDGIKAAVPYCVAARVTACVRCWPGLSGLADAGTRSWGHLTVDELEEWKVSG